MTQQTPSIAFDEERAAGYDERFAKLSSFKDALHLSARAVLAELPASARILCVGAGTGAEMLYFAGEFPGWTFTLVEPAAPMLARCRKRAEEAGFAARCAFHEGYLATLPPDEPFDAATSILVSQFVTDTQGRRDFFRHIAERLVPEGHLVTSDLSGPVPGALFEAWMAIMRYNDLDEAGAAAYRAAVSEHVAIVPPAQVEALIESAGFTAPLRICQTLLIHTWHARRLA